MGEFEEEEFGRNDAADTSQSSSAASSGGGATWRVRARRVLSDQYVLEEVEPGSIEAARVLSLHQTMKTRARLYAHQLRQLSVFFREDPAVRGVVDEADVTALKIACQGTSGSPCGRTFDLPVR
ncbi:MAG: hypothetical protein ACTHV2_08215, partial [Brachybacterium sp.]